MTAIAIGKKILFVSFAITSALFISLQLLEATTANYRPPGSGTSLHEIGGLDAAISGFEYLQSAKELFAKSPVPVAFQDSFVQKKIQYLRQEGEPVAFLFSRQLYGIDKHYQIIGLADSLDFYDLPIISADSLMIDPDNLKLECEKVKQAVKLIRTINKLDPALAARLSELRIDNSLGLVGYFDWGYGIYVIFGKDQLWQNLNNLHSFYLSLGDTKLINKTQSLDLRYHGRIILKKRNV